MSMVHRKRKNVGLLYEFLVRTASTAVVDGDAAKSALALELLRKHFKKGSVLHNEFRLFNSLMKVQITSTAVASTILREARNAARGHEVSDLDRAKSRLVNEMNRAFDDPTLWDTPIPNYRVYATIGTLISEWRAADGCVDISKLAEYEDKLVTWMTESKVVPQELVESQPDGTERLALRLALRKFNEKYSSALIPEQKDIIRQWALARHSGKPEAIVRALGSVKEKALATFDEALSDTEMETVNVQLTEAKKQLIAESLSVDTVDDETIRRFMLYVKLVSEIQTKDVDVKP